MPFDGFPRNVRATPVPDPLFNSLLEEIEDTAELKVTLRLIWLLGQKRGQLRSVTESELLGDATLARGLNGQGGEPADRIRQGLNLALARGTLLAHTGDSKADARCYLLNTEYNRRRLAREPASVRKSTTPGDHLDANVDVTSSPARLHASSIYDLYENNIGTIGPLMAEQLAEAEERYPPQWVEEAFKLAAYENKRSWRYIAAILRRWASEGRDGTGGPARDSTNTPPGLGVKAGATLWEADGREHGKPGRHTEEDDRSRKPRSRQRR